MKRFISSVIAALLIICCIPSAFAAEMPDCRVKLVASHLSAKAGDEVKISLIFENAADYPYGLAAFTASLKYDSSAVKLKEIKSAAPRSDVTSSNKPGLVKTLYIFASATMQPGFNKNDVFYTATFTVLDSKVDIADFSVTFDAITVSEYYTDKDGKTKVNNHQVKFNSPKINVDIIGNETPVQSQSSSSTSVSTQSSTSVQSALSGSSASNESAPTQSKPESVENDEFVDVEQGDNDKISVDLFDDDGNLSSETEKVNSAVSLPSSGQVASKPEVPVQNGDGSLFTVVILIFAASVIGAAAAITIIIVRKNKH